MSLPEWTEVFRLAEQRFLRQIKNPGEPTKISQEDLERDKIQSDEALLYKPHKYQKKDKPELSTRYRQKFYSASPPDSILNKEIISVLVNMDHTISLLDQGVCYLVKTYEHIMKMMAASNDSLDEKISIINMVIGNNPPGLAETY